ncbi:hypothetical protein M0D21_08505 [Aquimarina sp. D1M17]|uniref:hypothetical protein n=1 Tax=Aquimarina acroporae TaxID=2937283 RepID=UPI0020C112BF|nr:hypothetical protein [Aquimarina acroporae]MCK8521607.1 hypothetical protein [Aquimarina acroporae]
MKNNIFIALLLLVQASSFGQDDMSYLKTIEGVTNKMIELISGDIGEERNWDEYRNLFLPRAQKMSLSVNKEGKERVRVMNLEEFIRNVGPFYKRDGFEEYAIGLEVNEFNGIANVFQSYYCRNLKGTFEKRGINSYQLVYSNERWWIASTLFTAETEKAKIPEKYLFKKDKEKIKKDNE